MSEGKKVRNDPDAESKDPSVPGFIARPDGAPVYHGFVVVPETMTGGWAYGAITAFETDEPQHEGDGFVVAPDGSRAGIAWATDTGDFYEILPPDDGRWGVYGVCFPKPVSCLADLVSNFRAVLPRIKQQYERVHDNT